MSDLVEIWEKPAAQEIYMIAGWRQWADAGAVSSGLPQYLIDQTGASKIGEIKPDEFYLFQIPGTHHLLRPEVKLREGHTEEVEARRNEFFYSGEGKNGLLIFLGEEPHRNEKRYAGAFFDLVEGLGVGRAAAVAGVYGAMPYDRDRNVSCVYSLQRMKDELSQYAVGFSDYEGGATISMYLAHCAEQRGIEFLRFCAFVPAYDFSRPSIAIQQMRIDKDFKAWYDLMRRLNHMFDLGLDLLDLEKRSNELVSSMDAKMEELERTVPQLKVGDYMEKVASDFTETPFAPLSDEWESALEDLFEDAEDESEP